MNGPSNGRLLSLLKLLCCAAIVGNSAGMIVSMHRDYDRISLADLAVLATSFAALSALAQAGRHPRWEFWAGFAAGALFIVLASRGSDGMQQPERGGVTSVVQMIASKYFNNNNKEMIVLGAAKYESCTCPECLSRYTERLAEHHLETTRSILGLCAAGLTGAVALVLKRKGGRGNGDAVGTVKGDRR